MDIEVLTLAKSYTDEHGLNIKRFGAKGDGLTDDTDAIQEALDVVAEDGGGTVFVPAGTYLVTGLKVGDNTRIAGVGYASCIALAPQVNDTSGRDVIENKDPVNGNENITISNIRVDGRRSDQTGHRGNCIGFWKCRRVTVSEVWAHHAGDSQASRGSGIYVSSGSDIIITSCYTYSNFRHGIGFTANPINVTVSDCITRGNYVEGVHVSTGTDVTITNVVAVSNQTIGIMTQNANPCTVTGCVARGNGWEGFGSSSGHTFFVNCVATDNGRQGMNLAATSNAIGYSSVVGGKFAQNGREGIRITKARDISISGVVIQGNGNDYDALKIEELATGGSPSGYISVTGSLLRARGEGRSLNIATDGYDYISVTGGFAPSGIYVPPSARHVRIDDDDDAETIPPSKIANLALWLDGSNITGHLGGDALQAWGDTSGLNNHAKQSEGEKRPFYTVTDSKFNGQPTVEFDGDGWLTLSRSQLGSTGLVCDESDRFTIAVCCHVQGAPDPEGRSQGTIISRGDTFRLIATVDAGGCYRTHIRGSYSTSISSAHAPTGDTPVVILIRWDGSTARMRFNGHWITLPVGTLRDEADIKIGARGDDGFRLEGVISELCVYDRDLTNDEVVDLETYLARKYGVPL